MKDVADGIAYMHNSGFIHMDLKPSNIIISNNRGKIIDLSGAVNISKKNQQSYYTVSYLPPGK